MINKLNKAVQNHKNLSFLYLILKMSIQNNKAYKEMKKTIINSGKIK